MCNGVKNCSEKIITHRFTIQAPFWRTGWFIFLCVLVLGVFIFVFFKVRVLTYNKDITRELIRLLVKRLKRKEKHHKAKREVRFGLLFFILISGFTILFITDLL